LSTNERRTVRFSRLDKDFKNKMYTKIFSFELFGFYFFGFYLWYRSKIEYQRNTNNSMELIYHKRVQKHHVHLLCIFSSTCRNRKIERNLRDYAEKYSQDCARSIHAFFSRFAMLQIGQLNGELSGYCAFDIGKCNRCTCQWSSK